MLHAVITAAAEEGGHETTNPLIPATYDIVWSLVCFAIIFAVFFWKVLPAIRKTLDERSEIIEGGIAKAENAQAEAAAALAEYNARLTEARAEAGRIREQARADGQRILADLKQQASVEAARITANAQAQIEAERQAALRPGPLRASVHPVAGRGGDRARSATSAGGGRAVRDVLRRPGSLQGVQRPLL